MLGHQVSLVEEHMEPCCFISEKKEEYPYLKIPLLTQLPVVFDLEIFKFLVDCLELTQ